MQNESRLRPYAASGSYAGPTDRQKNTGLDRIDESRARGACSFANSSTGLQHFTIIAWDRAAPQRSVGIAIQSIGCMH